MKIKHSKYRNTGLIYELLVKQITADTLENRKSPAVKILKRHYKSNTFLAKEYKLYEFTMKSRGISRSKAESILSTVTEISQRLDQKSLKKQKYNLIAEIKENYDLNEFFSIQVRDYTPLAALYCLLEAQNTKDMVDPEVLVENKQTVLQHLTVEKHSKKSVRESLIEEYSKYDKDLRLIVYKILLEKFNKRYGNFSNEQKGVLREFITSVDSSTRLRDFTNECLKDIKRRINEKRKKISNEVIDIKLEEVVNNIEFIKKGRPVEDDHISLLLQYYQLLEEIENL